MSSTIKKTCRDCGRIFEIGFDEAREFLDRGFQIPVRCSGCRKNKKVVNKHVR